MDVNRLVIDDLYIGARWLYVTLDATDVVSQSIAVGVLDAINATVTASHWFSRLGSESSTAFTLSPDSSVSLTDLDIAGGMRGMGFQGFFKCDSYPRLGARQSGNWN